ncbi:MAG: hypothetical protein OIN86_10730 [Candidatus Methanoperedens sp.]|nr:hypothetical protein [Candidatus Methanoperedens sp.]
MVSERNGTVRGINYEEEKKTDSSRRERNNNKRNNYFYLGAVDLDDEKILAFWVSFGRSGLETKVFLKALNPNKYI